jgi:hypothetical protein
MGYLKENAVHSTIVFAALLWPVSAFTAEHVEVVNPPSHPVPVTGSVGVAGTPTVNIGTIPSVNASIQDPAKSFFQINSPVNGNGTAGTIATVLTVPTGKRGVLEALSISCNFPTGTGPTLALVYSVYSVSGNQAVYVPLYILLQKQGSGDGYDTYVGSFSGRFYVDSTSFAGSVLGAQIQADTSSNWFCRVGGSGYYVTL